MKTTTKGGGLIQSRFIAVKRKRTGLTDYFEVRQTPAGPINIPLSKEDYLAGGGIDPEDPSLVGSPSFVAPKAQRITEYAIQEVGAYNLTGQWYSSSEEATAAIEAQFGPSAPMFQVVEVTYDDLAEHIPILLAQVQKNRLEEADALSAAESAGVEALRKKVHPDIAMGDLTHDQRVALANLYHKGAKK